METLTISRVIFLLFIITLSTYFIYLNKSYKEHFEDSKDNSPLTNDKIVEIVKATYLTEFKRNPLDKEILFFQAYNVEKKPTQEQLINVIKNSADLLNKRYDNNNFFVSGETLGTEDDVTEVYNAILNRLPDEQELENFSKMLKNDKDFTLDKLKQILYGSEEYKRLEKTQTNLVYSNLMGGVTDRQITLIVTTNYKNIVGKDFIDPDELSFLKKKLVEFNLDEKIFKLFLENYIKNVPFNQSLAASQKAREFVSDEQKLNKGVDQESVNQMKKELYTQLMEDLKKQSLINQENKALQDQKGKELKQIEQPNKQVIEVLLKTSNNSQQSNSRNDNYLDSSDVLDTIKKEAKCVFDKNALDKHYASTGKESMSDLIEKRNSQLLKDTCVRNRMYLGLDEDMVLDPSLRWKMPERRPPVCVGGENSYQPTVTQTALIGTLLEDAKKTKVGSVVDFLPPK